MYSNREIHQLIEQVVRQDKKIKELEHLLYLAEEDLAIIRHQLAVTENRERDVREMYAKLVVENADLSRQLEECTRKISTAKETGERLAKVKIPSEAITRCLLSELQYLYQWSKNE